MLATVEAVVAVLVSVFLFDEAMTVGILAGILLIIGGIALMSSGASRQNKPRRKICVAVKGLFFYGGSQIFLALFGRIWYNKKTEMDFILLR